MPGPVCTTVHENQEETSRDDICGADFRGWIRPLASRQNYMSILGVLIYLTDEDSNPSL